MKKYKVEDVVTLTTDISLIKKIWLENRHAGMKVKINRCDKKIGRYYFSDGEHHDWFFTNEQIAKENKKITNWKKEMKRK